MPKLPARPQQPASAENVRARRRSAARRSAVHVITEWWWQCGCTTAVTSDRSGTCQRSPGPIGAGAVEQLGERAGLAAATATARGSSGSRSSRSERSTAVHDGSSPTIGMPLTANGPSTSSRCVELLPRAVELAGADPGQAAAGVVVRHEHLVARRRAGPRRPPCATVGVRSSRERVGPRARAASTRLRRPGRRRSRPRVRWANDRRHRLVARRAGTDAPVRRPRRGTAGGRSHHLRRGSMPPTASTAWRRTSRRPRWPAASRGARDGRAQRGSQPSA